MNAFFKRSLITSKYMSNILDDERIALEGRFKEEGLEKNLADERKLPHVWRWLQDAESNCLSLRRQIDKLHKQHEKDIQEVEAYVENVWRLASEKMKSLETENKALKQDLSQVKQSRLEETAHEGSKVRTLGNFLHIKRKDKVLPLLDDASNNQEKEMCHKCSKSKKKSDETIRKLIDANQVLENENELMSVKISEINAKNSEKKHRQNANEKLVNQHNNTALDSVQVSSQMLDEADHEVVLVEEEGNQIERLKAEVEQLKSELKTKENYLQSLISSSEKRKARQRQKILILREHVERENKRWQQLFQMANLKRQAMPRSSFSSSKNNTKAVDMHKENLSALERIAK
ncbi:hypothetical protein HDE_00034 [Halotydeus destructor]|nr:hypothetical protein HDE_00034 [Halotydeus destructor]